MLTRILTGVIALIVFLPFLVHSDTVAYPIAMGLCAVLSVYELIRCVGLHKKHHITLPLCAVGGALPICIRLLGITETLYIAVAVSLVLAIYLLGVTIFSHGTVLIHESMTVLAVSLYIIAAFTAMVYLHDFNPAGKYLYLLAFIGAWVPDTFAYFTGRLFGKHKLIPDVSPKKTVEGAIGGALFCILAFVIFGLIYNHRVTDQMGQLYDHVVLPVWLMAVVGLLSAVVSMIGDLSMSVIKRHWGVKDYGNILPGHGGFLDRFDSVLAVAVILAVAFMTASWAGIL